MEKEERMEISAILTSHCVTLKKSIEYHEKHLKIAIEIGGRREEEAAYGNLGNCYQSLSDSRKSIECHEKHSKLQKKSVIGVEKEERMEISAILTSHCVTLKNPLSTMRNI